MDLATIIGLLGAFGFVIWAILLHGELGMYYDITAVMIVFGGSTFAVLMKFSMTQFLGAMKVAGRAFSYKLPRAEDLIEEIVQLADASRRGGLLSLEGKEVSNDFLAKGIQLLVDGHDGDVVHDVLSKELHETEARHEWGAKIFDAWGELGPASGMIGTLIGLVAMMGNMEDPKTIGPAMAVALLATLYGAVLANMIALPIAGKLKLRRAEEARIKSMVIDALVAIQGGQNPRVVSSMLQSYLPPSKRSGES